MSFDAKNWLVSCRSSALRRRGNQRPLAKNSREASTADASAVLSAISRGKNATGRPVVNDGRRSCHIGNESGIVGLLSIPAGTLCGLLTRCHLIHPAAKQIQGSSLGRHRLAGWHCAVTHSMMLLYDDGVDVILRRRCCCYLPRCRARSPMVLAQRRRRWWLVHR